MRNLWITISVILTFLLVLSSFYFNFQLETLNNSFTEVFVSSYHLGCTENVENKKVCIKSTKKFEKQVRELFKNFKDI